MAPSWSTLPKTAIADIRRIEVDFPKADVEKLQQLVRDSIIAPATFWSVEPSSKFGITHEWLTKAQHYWQGQFSWEREQKNINRHPHFMAEIIDDSGSKYDVHFMALFSTRSDATPIAFFHGWPGSFLEFMGLFDIIKSKFTPETSPYHIVAPSLPGYTLSSGMPIDKLIDIPSVSGIMDKLLSKIGFIKGYVAQGGDVGSWVAQGLAHASPNAKAVHGQEYMLRYLEYNSSLRTVNLLNPIKPQNESPAAEDASLDDYEKSLPDSFLEWMKKDMAYGIMAGTRPATLGFVLSSSPVALLAWVGEKMLAWSDPRAPLPMEEIVTSVSLYWLTNTISRSLWPYAGISADPGAGFSPPPPVPKPMGYSRFRHEVMAAPHKWARELGDLRFFRHHDDGGHFAAWERPDLLWGDVEAFVMQVLPNGLDT